MIEVKHPSDYFKTFNNFFIRELKPGVRPMHLWNVVMLQYVLLFAD